ncbi:MAG TPA: hypothetical protein PKE20_04510 [Promineifilum sp.]|nr:hypothetical protein [Promineifilum sp.]
MKDSARNFFITRRTARQAGDAGIILESMGLEARAPFGGVVWNRPTAVRVRGPAGETRLPIRDVTRRGQLLLYGLSLLFVLAGLAARGRPVRE